MGRKYKRASKKSGNSKSTSLGASKRSGNFKSSEASIIETDPSRKTLRKFLNRKDTPSEMKNLCEEVLKQLKEAELQLKYLEYQAVEFEKKYQCLLDISGAKSAEIQDEIYKKVEYQKWYLAMKIPKVVYTEITEFEKRRRDKFNLKDINTEGLEEHVINNEVRAELWKFMLKNLEDSEVQFLKRSIIFQKLFKSKLKYFTKCDRDAFKNIEKATGNERFELNYAIEKRLIQRWSKDDFIKSLFTYLNEGSCTKNSCQTWCTYVIDNFADMISEVFSAISEIPIRADYVRQCVPGEYRIFRTPEYQETIILLMSYYKSSNWMDNWIL